ncbi:KHG/KDPG aldolase [Klebsormidium nitens]|uniref:KHG/KDPG aldolase n=1 Tax=Klebsormidium nitens TaxID=105231 RepID=A0A0U9HMC6_KLENI|nr:KHG/KDPG aldolase [Klebsormidium nitens]|eukprot:GAQ80237.1 KHG/KDPG aldolase [Klebsormidium nitens]
MGPSSLDPERSAAFVEECRGLMDDFLHGRFEGTFPETVLRSQLEKLARFFKTTPGLKDCPAGTWAPFKIHDERQSVSLSVLQLWVQVAELRSLTPPDPWSRAYREQLSHLAAAQSLVDYWVRMWDRTSNSGNCSERSSAEYGTLLENVSMVIDMADRQFVLNIANDMVAHLRSGEEAPSGTAKAASAVIETGIIACVKIENQDLALNAARAALNGGVTVLELTMTVPGALESVKTLVDEFPNAIIGVGTIYTAEEAAAAAQAGAHFVMSPIFNEEIVDVQKKLDVLYIPGAMTPTEIWTAHRSGCQIVKVFPASEATLRALRRPLASLQDPPLSLVASHGIRKEDVGRYLGDRLASAVVLSDAIFGHDRSADITAAARRVVAVAKAHKR